MSLGSVGRASRAAAAKAKPSRVAAKAARHAAKTPQYVVIDNSGPEPVLARYAGPPVSKIRVDKVINLRDLTDELVLQIDSDAADGPGVESPSTRESGRQEGRASIPMRSKRTVERRDALLKRAQDNLARRKGGQG